MKTIFFFFCSLTLLWGAGVKWINSFPLLIFKVNMCVNHLQVKGWRRQQCLWRRILIHHQAEQLNYFVSPRSQQVRVSLCNQRGRDTVVTQQFMHLLRDARITAPLRAVSLLLENAKKNSIFQTAPFSGAKNRRISAEVFFYYYFFLFPAAFFVFPFATPLSFGPFVSHAPG